MGVYRLLIHPCFIFATKIAKTGCARHNLSKLGSALTGTVLAPDDAEDLVEALEKARAMMAEPIPQKELTPLRIFYDNIREDGKEVTVG